MSGDHTVTTKLTKRAVDALVVGPERYLAWDIELKGFGVRVTPEGRKTYIVRYRTIGGARRMLTLATHGVLTTEEAREEARKALARVAMGGDPQGVKAERRAEMTVRELCDLYMAEVTATKKATTLHIDRIRIKRHINPRIGNMKVTDVARSDIQRLMIDVGNGNIRKDATPHTRGGKGAAARTVGLLGGIFNFAVDYGFIAQSPVRGVKRYRDNRRDRFLSPAELGRLGDVLSDLEKDGGDPRHITILRLLALTGARKSEIARLRWSELDLDRGLLRLRDSKTGPKIIPLGVAALELVAALKSNGSVYLFPDRRRPDQPVANLDWAWVCIRKKAGLDDVRIHDLRHSFASAGLASGEGLPLIGKLLGHAHVATTSRYADLADDPIRAAADRISRNVAETLLRRSAEAEMIMCSVSRYKTLAVCSVSRYVSGDVNGCGG